ncbi:MAG TPA: MBOAT family O-acyltransferase, partial [Flavobacteriales bacterium]|nr:MBOAT family O-acyltransferase [Flavobacteriales bacterium]
MLFNSLAFAAFLPTVFALYWLLHRHLRAQNIIIVLASYVFYGWWDVRFLALLLFSTALDYYTGLRIEGAEHPGRRRFWLWLSIGINLGFLGLFKYYNFFISGFAELLEACHMQAHLPLLKVILPVGISFYTFHGLSYVIDIYKRRIKAERSFIDYSVFVSFFALLVAGPIERATHLLPQVTRPRTFDSAMATDGMRQMLWGFFKKVVIADNCAPMVNDIFANTQWHTADTLALGAILFAFQIYGDFSGYSDIAIGFARLFGFELLRNFAYPYFSRDIAEFWRRWHISLSSWFRDYVYLPLGGSRGTGWLRVRNVFTIFLLSGFWHGANWTFIAWGAINALLFLPLLLRGKNRQHD